MESLKILNSGRILKLFTNVGTLCMVGNFYMISSIFSKLALLRIKNMLI